jgi:hypothetical protein
VRFGRVLNSADYGWKHRVHEIRDQHTNCEGAVLFQRGSDNVRVVAEFLGRLFDLPDYRGRDLVAFLRTERSRHSPVMDVNQIGDVAYGHFSFCFALHRLKLPTG